MAARRTSECRCVSSATQCKSVYDVGASGAAEEYLHRRCRAARDGIVRVVEDVQHDIERPRIGYAFKRAQSGEPRRCGSRRFEDGDEPVNGSCANDREPCNCRVARDGAAGREVGDQLIDLFAGRRPDRHPDNLPSAIHNLQKELRWERLRLFGATVLYESGDAARRRPARASADRQDDDHDHGRAAARLERRDDGRLAGISRCCDHDSRADDVDVVYQRAVDAGGKPMLPICDTFYGIGWVGWPIPSATSGRFRRSGKK